MRLAIGWALVGARDGAALFGITVALLGGASASLLLFFWGVGVLTHLVLQRISSSIVPSRTEVER